ncbi:hypothetical protein MIND_00265000 [Mycena indigotica]|uniref:Uncharacterized protein n=1 Tax=Mycena indigotica TaxID=2126181 RepID=A0A8H6WF47_9AGAR|nr:uncharacterized protein MIND_00265000 [Mycena indigotica]KAF7312513.1 hypothetical protein MIND_00265000 [Mycena indigotica]
MAVGGQGCRLSRGAGDLLSTSPTLHQQLSAYFSDSTPWLARYAELVRARCGELGQSSRVHVHQDQHSNNSPPRYTTSDVMNAVYLNYYTIISRNLKQHRNRRFNDGHRHQYLCQWRWTRITMRDSGRPAILSRVKQKRPWEVMEMDGGEEIDELDDSEEGNGKTTAEHLDKTRHAAGVNVTRSNRCTSRL